MLYDVYIGHDRFFWDSPAGKLKLVIMATYTIELTLLSRYIAKNMSFVFDYNQLQYDIA